MLKPLSESSLSEITRFINERFILLLVGCLWLSLTGCSKGPGEKWAKDAVIELLNKSNLWVAKDVRPQIANDYYFGEYEMADNGKKGRIQVIFLSPVYDSFSLGHRDLFGPKYKPGKEHWFEFYQDGYGKWSLGLL